MFWNRYKSGPFTEIARSARIGAGATLGTWAKIESDAQIGPGAVIGDWSAVGARSIVGRDAVFGSWAKIGADVVLGEGVRLGSHTRVQDGVVVPDHAVFDDGDLVTRDGVIANRVGGRVSGGDDQGPKMVSGPFGRFEIPADVPIDMADFEAMIEDFFWGRSDTLERYRVPAPEASVDVSPA
jgi:tetrahydrodipicolinate N-succinyltransferase